MEEGDLADGKNLCDTFVSQKSIMDFSLKIFTKEGVLIMVAQETVARQKESDGWLSALDFLWLKITRRCNLRCIHCCADSGVQYPLMGIMRCGDWEHVLEEGASLGCGTVQFTGGEPTLHPNLIRLISKARALGYGFIEVFTNGTFLDVSMLKTFRQLGVHLAFSMYGSNAEIHESVTQKKGSFRKIMGGIRGALDSGIMVRAGIILTDKNKDDLEGTRDMLTRMGVTTISVDRLRKVGRGNRSTHHASGFDELCGSCWKGKLLVDPDGYVSPCLFSRFYSLGDARGGLAPILNSGRLWEFRKKVRDQEAYRASCVPNTCSPDTCSPAARPCSPDCAPACSPCVPDIRR